MRPFYWIDSFDGYPESMDGPIATSLETYATLYTAYAREWGHCFRLVRLEDLHIASGNTPVVWHDRYGNLLAHDCAAYVGLIHPDPKKERKLEALYRLVAGSGTVRLINQTPRVPMICKDKFGGLTIAAHLGLRVPPSVLIDGDRRVPSQIDFAERMLGPYPMFVRPNDLTSGLGKRVANDREVLQTYINRPPFPGRLSLVQPCISVEAEFRVYLDGLDAIACRKRGPLDLGDFCITPKAIQHVSLALAAFLKTAYLCVDWLWDGRNFWFCEFETGGGFSELGEPHRSRVAAAFFRRLTE